MRTFLGYTLAALLTASVAVPAMAQTGSAPGSTPAMTKPLADAPKAVPTKPIAATPGHGTVAGQKPAATQTGTVAPAPIAPVTKSN